jgi:ABC-type spermidine/putrescine transport system permease subunit I
VADPPSVATKEPETPKAANEPKPAKAPKAHHSSLWPLLALPGTLWLILFFILPMYVVMAIVFGRVDPIFRTPLPVWNPLQWNPAQFNYVFSHLVGKDGFFGPALLRTLLFVVLASLLCLLVAYPVAYFTARFAGKHKALILTLLIAPFWISYMMRMLAWVNLLQNDGLVNRGLGLGGLFHVNVDWLSGRASTVILGLVYGYVPYMILPLFAGLDRIQTSVLEAARDLGAGRLSTFWRVTWRLSLPAIVASVLLSCLPMLGDYFTNDLLSASPSTSMVGNLINNSALAAGQTGQAGAFVLLVLVVSLIPMFWYVRTTRDDGARS